MSDVDPDLKTMVDTCRALARTLAELDPMSERALAAGLMFITGALKTKYGLIEGVSCAFNALQRKPNDEIQAVINEYLAPAPAPK